MHELGLETRSKLLLKVFSVAIAALTISACSKAEHKAKVEATPSSIEAEDSPKIEYPQTMWGLEFIDVTENATVECASVKGDSQNANYGYSDFLTSRPWFISGNGTVENSYQDGGFIGDSNEVPDNSLVNSVKSGFYVHRGAKNHFGIYLTTGKYRYSDESGPKELELKFIDSFSLEELGQNGTVTYETDEITVILTQSDDLPHYYDASMDYLLRYPSAYPQGLSGAEEGPGLAVEVLCKVSGSNLRPSTERAEVVEEIV